MKKWMACLILATNLFSVSFAETAEKVAPPKYTGTDWLLMTPDEKVAAIDSIIIFLKSKAIPVQRPAGYYGAMLNTVVDRPGAERAELINLVMTLVHNNEPQTRPLIDQLRSKPDAKKTARF